MFSNLVLNYISFLLSTIPQAYMHPHIRQYSSKLQKFKTSEIMGPNICCLYYLYPYYSPFKSKTSVRTSEFMSLHTCCVKYLQWNVLNYSYPCSLIRPRLYVCNVIFSRYDIRLDPIRVFNSAGPLLYPLSRNHRILP